MITFIRFVLLLREQQDFEIVNLVRGERRRVSTGLQLWKPELEMIETRSKLFKKVFSIIFGDESM